MEQFRIEHGPGRGGRLAAGVLEVEPDPAEVRVVLETRHGLLVEALVDAGFPVLPVNPDLVARRRGPARTSSTNSGSFGSTATRSPARPEARPSTGKVRARERGHLAAAIASRLCRVQPSPACHWSRGRPTVASTQ